MAVMLALRCARHLWMLETTSRRDALQALEAADIVPFRNGASPLEFHAADANVLCDHPYYTLG